MDQLDFIALNRNGISGRGTPEHVLERAQHQRQRCAKLVADVGEKRRLRPVDLGKGFGASALLLVGTRICERLCHMGRNRLEEAHIRAIESAARADAADEDSDRMARGHTDGNLHCLGARLEPCTIAQNGPQYREIRNPCGTA